MSAAPIVMRQMKPVWGLPNARPFCIANVLWVPIASPLGDALREHANLVAFCERMKQRYFAGWTAGA